MRRNLLGGLLGLMIALAGLSPCFAEADVGSPAPAIEPAEFVNGAAWPRRARERRVRLVSLTRTWSTACEHEVAVLDDLHRRFHDRGLTVVSVTNESRESVEQFVARTKARHLFVIEKGDSAHSYGLRTGFPTVYLLDVDGIVRWRGNWAREAETELRALLRHVVLRPRLDAKFEPIARAVADEKLPEAWKRIVEARARPTITAAERRSLSALVAWVEDSGRSELDEAQVPWTKRDWYAAWLRLTAIEERYAGFETARLARKRIRDLLSDPGRLKEVKGGRALTDLRESIAGDPPQRAIATLKRVLFPYRETRAWAEAKKLIEELENPDPEPR